MADFSKCSAGTLFYGRTSRLKHISKWWKYAMPSSPSAIVDSTKIRLISLYVTQSNSGTKNDLISELPGLESPSGLPTDGCSSFVSLPRGAFRQPEQAQQLLDRGQFWLNFMVNKNISLAQVNFEVCKYFGQIPFHHWIQAALGHRSQAVNDLFMSVAMIRYQYGKLHEKPGRKPKARSLPEISQVHPLTKAVFDERLDSFLPMDGMSFILDPIRTVLSRSPPSELDQHLIILGLRFETSFIRPPMVDWSSSLSLNFSFVETLNRDGPKMLAKSITAGDLKVLSNLTMEQLQNGTRTPADTRWVQLYHDVEESVVSNHEMSTLIVELARTLYFSRNYFSMTAVVAGVKAAGENFPRTPSSIKELAVLQEFLDERNNYAYCRARTISDRALPWLVPFRIQYKSRASRPYSTAVIAMANIALQICCYDRSYVLKS